MGNSGLYGRIRRLRQQPTTITAGCGCWFSRLGGYVHTKLATPYRRLLRSLIRLGRQVVNHYELWLAGEQCVVMVASEIAFAGLNRTTNGYRLLLSSP